MEFVVARAFIAGFCGGASIGPVVWWGSQLLRRNAKDAATVILGASSGDCLLAAVVMTLVIRFDMPLAHVRTAFEPFETPLLLVAGVVLLCLRVEPSTKEWSERLRFFAAFGFTAFWPTTVLFVAIWLGEWWRSSDPLIEFAPAYAAGVLAAWTVCVTAAYLLQRRIAHIVRVVGAACIMLAIGNLAQAFG